MNRELKYKNFKTLLVAMMALLMPAITNATSIHHEDHDKTFEVKEGVVVEITNKHGDIEFTKWDNNAVRIQAFVRIEAKKDKTVKRMAESLNVEIKGNTYVISATTTIGDAHSIFSKAVQATSDVAGEFLGSQKMTIDYKISLPEYAEIMVENKFGNVYLHENVKRFTGKISHGDLRGRRVDEITSLEMGFGKCHLKSVGSARMDLDWTKLFLDDADNAIIKASASDCIMKEIKVLTLDTKGGSFVLDNVNSLMGKSTLTDFVVKRLNGELNMTTKYGSLVIQEMGKTFSAIQLNGSNSDYVLTFEAGSQFAFDFDLEKPDVLEFPRQKVTIQQEEMDKNDVQIVKGSVGGMEKPDFRVKAKNSRLSWNIR